MQITSRHLHTASGYVQVRLSDGSNGLEHRVLMEEYLGRKLPRHEVVHHINGVKSDNRLANLEVMLLHEHSRHHSTGKQASEAARKRMSASQIGRKHSPETRKKIGDGNRGKQRTAATLRRMGAARDDFTHSEETRERIRASSIGIRPSAETRQKMSEARRLYWAKKRAQP